MNESSPLSSTTLLAILNASPIGMLLIDRQGDICYANPRAEKVFGYDHNELIHISVNQLVPDKLQQLHEKMRQEFMGDHTPRAMDHGRILPAKTKDGREIQLQLGLTPLKTEKESYVLVSIIDKTNTILKVASYHDSLTGLANRNLFRELAENLRNLAIRNHTGLALLFLDLDGFKGINDECGHAAGDMVLCEVAEILNKSVRKNDIACRLGGDEFLLCLYGINNISHLNKISQNLIQSISNIQKNNKLQAKVSASIGAINTLNPENISLEDMIRYADELMYAAKKAGKNQVIYKDISESTPDI